MAGPEKNVPEGFEILSTVDTSGLAAEYIARHKTDNALVKLRVYDFAQADSATARRNLREYLRCDIAFMEELDDPGLIRIFDYSDTKNAFWIATQPAKAEKIAKCFDLLASQSVDFRRRLACQFLEVIQRVHNSGVVHRNLSTDSVCLSQDLKILVGDFGFACYASGHHTISQNTTAVTTMGYQPPEVRDAKTFSCNPSCDIFSAALVVFEILSAAVLPKQHPGEIGEVLRNRTNEEVAKGILTAATADVILKAASPSPDKRWPTARAFADALAESFQDKPTIQGPGPAAPTATVAITEPVTDAMLTIPIGTVTDAAEPPPAPAVARPTAKTMTPLDATHEMWNNRYEILQKIGEGGQAIVYKAHDHLTNEDIAIKTIWSRHREDRAAINRLKQGAMVARSLTHRNIIKTYSVEQRTDTDAFGNYVFVCMELIKSQMDLGGVLETRRTAESKISLPEALHVTRQLLDALAYAHEHTVHRDIKPGNIMLVARDEKTQNDYSDLTKFDIRLIDFGIAKVLGQKHIDVTGKGFRSAHYGAPELADAQTGVDARADLFSVGVVMYQMLTGAIPRKGSPPANKVNKEVPSALARVIDKAINADREKRFKTAAEFVKELEWSVSKFNWVRKAAKAAAVLLIAACIAATVKYFMPEPDYLPVAESVETLQVREPDAEIADLNDDVVVTYSDIAGFASYNQLRKKAIDGLQGVRMAGHEKFKQSFPLWQQQQQVWASVAPAVAKLQQIADDRYRYAAQKNANVVGHLLNLTPSSDIISSIRDEADQAEKLLQKRPFQQDVLDDCLDAYDLAASVHQNVVALAAGSDAPQAAVEINDKLKNVDELKGDTMRMWASVADIEPLKAFGFHQRGRECLEKADRYRQTFDLAKTQKYFSLLGQVCGTMASVKGQVDFEDSDIGLIGSRLMELCYDDVETFDKYPSWKEKLEQVHRKKDILANYVLLQSLISATDDVSPAVYDLMISARGLCEQGQWDNAGAELAAARDSYRQYLRARIDKFKDDCDSLQQFPSVSPQALQSCTEGIGRLDSLLGRLTWPQPDFAEKYGTCRRRVDDAKNLVRDRLIQQATQSRSQIVKSYDLAGQDNFFYNSRLISKLLTVAGNYRKEDVGQSIQNWKFVEDLPRLSAIVKQMEQLSSHLDRMSARKQQLDLLAADIDQAVDFCKKFKGISPEERQKYKKWQSDLLQLRADLTEPERNVCLIDRPDEAFDADFDNLRSAYSEIRAKLPFHRSRVIELIKKTHWLEDSTAFTFEFRQRWADILVESRPSQMQPGLGDIRSYLQEVQDDVDNWTPEKFNAQMNERCRVLSERLLDQHQTTDTTVTAILAQKTRLTKDIDLVQDEVRRILADEDIRELAESASSGEPQALTEFRQLPRLLSDSMAELSELDLETLAAWQPIMTNEATTNFELDPWLESFNDRQKGLTRHISQLRLAQDMLPAFRQVREKLTQHSSLEHRYYLALRDHALESIGYADVTDSLDALEGDDQVVRMCSFLTRMQNQDVPTIENLRAALTEISHELARLKSLDIETLPAAKAFNKQRKALLDRVALVRQQAQKLDTTNLEPQCKKTIIAGVTQMKSLVAASGSGDELAELNSALWSFFPYQRQWSEWETFLELYHVVVSDDQLKLASSAFLSPSNRRGDVLTLEEIASDHRALFNFDLIDPADFGWPRHVIHEKDPTIALTFVPRVSSALPGPYYMAAREISNRQYKLFLEQYGAESLTNLKGWCCFGRKNEKPLITQTQGQFPPARITWDKSSRTFSVDSRFERDPVAWVTFHGAQVYAHWLNAELPTVAQFVHAAQASAKTAYPWGDDLSDAAAHVHIRADAWKQAARKYNATRDNPVEIAYPPVGAVKDFLAGKALDPANIVHAGQSLYPVWPCFTKDSKPNSWGLHDMVGNVWEWCSNVENDDAPVICGGSCLSPPQYIAPDAKHEFKAQAADVGFRIVIPAR